MGVIDNSLPRMIADQIAADILEGRLEQGERIIEDRYAEQFGTSRAPVREALYLLAIEGLIERQPRRGAFVKQYTMQDIRDLFRVRLMLELMAIERVELPLSAADIHQIERLLEQMASLVHAEEYHVQYASLNRQFHYRIIQLSKSEVFTMLYQRLGSPLFVLQRLSFYTIQNRQHSFDDHKMIWELIKSGRITAAQGVLQEHHEGALRRLEKILKEKKHILDYNNY